MVITAAGAASTVWAVMTAVGAYQLEIGEGRIEPAGDSHDRYDLRQEDERGKGALEWRSVSRQTERCRAPSTVESDAAERPIIRLFFSASIHSRSPRTSTYHRVE
jgi:hypothetical protein